MALRWKQRPPGWGQKRKREYTEPVPRVNRGKEPVQRTAESVQHADARERPQILGALASHLLAGHTPANLARLRNWNLFADSPLHVHQPSRGPLTCSESAAAMSVNMFMAPQLVKPKRAVDHEQQVSGHTCQPRSLRTNAPPQFVWDFPMPVPVDVRPWRCVECSHCGQSQRGEDTTYMKVSPEDVQAVVPDAWCIQVPLKGTFFVTIRFLLRFLTVLSGELNFRQTRRKLLDTYIANIIGAIGRLPAGHVPDVQGILQRFFNPEASK